MLSFSSSVRIYIARKPIDFHKAHDGLVAIIRDEFDEDPFDGSVFVFLNRNSDRVKLIHWDRDGLWLHYKRLETELISRGGKSEARLTHQDVMRNVRIATMEQQAGLPDDVDALKALVLKMRDDIAKLEHNVEVYKRLAFGAKSERRAPVAPSGITPNQGHLFYADLASEAAEAAERNKCNSELQAVKPATSRKTGGRSSPSTCQRFVLRTHSPKAIVLAADAAANCTRLASTSAASLNALR